MDLLLQKRACSLLYLFRANVLERSLNLCNGTIHNTLGRRLNDRLSFWQVISRSGCMSVIYLLTVLFNLSNLFIIYFKKLLHFNYLLFFISNTVMCLLTWVMGVLSSTSWFIINLFIYLFFFVVVSAACRKSTTKCIWEWFKWNLFN
jgi:hypothetical protein